MKSFVFVAASILGLAIGASAAPISFQVDPVKSQLHWIGSKVVGSSHNGTVKIASGQIQVENGIIKGGDFVVDMTSIESLDLKDKTKDKLKLENHLKSDDFFGAQKYPAAKFKIMKVTAPSTTKDFTHDITGDLTIKEKTVSITIPSRVTLTSADATADGAVEIDRTQFDVKFGSKKFFENLVGDRVINDKFKIEMKLVAKK